MWHNLGEIYIDQVNSQYIKYITFTKEYYRFCHQSFLYSYLKLVMTGTIGIYQN